MKAPARIVTFYSYKGGVGRTAALANTAWILASNGHRVCVIDWDLEAPGLHRYFSPFLVDRELTSTDGLIDFLVDYLNQAMTPFTEPRPDDWYRPYADLSTYAVPVKWNHFTAPGSLDLVVAGRQGPSYAAKVNSFEWQTFYQRFGGGTFIDEVKRQLRAEYDFVLVDSRTGISDTAGICTVQLPDQLVACFMHNTQSIEGTAAVVESAVRLRADDAPLEVFPVPMRVELAEKERLDRARVFARQRFSQFLRLRPEEELGYWSEVEVIYQAYYAYEEVLATFSDPVGNKLTVLNAMENLCGRLTHGEVTRLRPPPEVDRQKIIDEYGQRFTVPEPASWTPAVQPATGVEPASGPSSPATEIPSPVEGVSLATVLAMVLSVTAASVAVIAMTEAPLWVFAVPLGLALAVTLSISRVLGVKSRNVYWLEGLLRRRVSRFDRRYREFLLGGLRFMDLKGLATIGFYTPQLDEVFVDVSLVHRAPHQVPGSMLASVPTDVTDRRSIGELLDNPQPITLAVLGPPGSGKTTLLRHTASVICRQRRGRRRSVPILLYLRDHVTGIVNGDVGLPELVRDTLPMPAPEGWFEERLGGGDCVVLLDGLDEMYRQEDRIAVAAWIERQTRKYAKNDFVITSRPHGYLTAPVNGAVVVQVRGFTDEQVTRFIRGWYLAVEIRSTGSTDEEVRRWAAQAADDLLARLNTSPALFDLTVNPLLLTMIANVHRHRGALPGSRSDLYGEICQVMLWRRQEAKRLSIDLSGEKKEALLRGLAFAMMRHRVRDMPYAEVLREIRPGLRRVSTGMTEGDFVADVSANGLLVERQSGVYAFAHFTFQEYLAAMHIRDRGLEQVLTQSVDDLWWRETTLYYIARADSDPIVAACLNSGSTSALSLAVDIAEQGSALAPELHERLERLLDLADDDPAHRRVITNVLITRYLRHTVRTAGGSRVCAEPVSASIYAAFQSETGVSGPDLAGVRPNEPATGMDRSDASRFVRWINDVTEGDPSYRLPERAEMDDPAVRRALARTPRLAVWVRSADGPELWTPSGPRVVDGTIFLATS